MPPKFKHTITILAVSLLAFFQTEISACTCIGKDKQTTESEFSISDLVVKGKIISITDFDYYDTVGYVAAGLRFDAEKTSYMIHRYKLFTYIIDKKFKSAQTASDTIRIITGYSDGDCGYEFEIGKEYIVYAETWKEKAITVQHRKRKLKRKISQITIPNTFYTDICRLTQELNQNELENLKRLTE